MIDNTSGSAVLSGRRLPYEEEDSSDSESSEYASENPQSDSKGELQKILIAIKQIVDLLYELSIVIRNATPLDKFSKAANENVSHFQVWDLRHTQEKFPQLEDNFLVKRLANANTRRRQIFKYLEKHQAKLSHSISPPDRILLQTPQTNNDETPKRVHLDDDTSQIKATASIKSRPSMTATSVNTQTTIATFNEPEQIEAEGLDDERLSETSSAKSENAAAESKIRIPGPPKGALDNQSFECPYCYDILRISSSLSWE